MPVFKSTDLPAEKRLFLRSKLAELMPKLESGVTSIRARALEEWDRVNREALGVKPPPAPTEAQLAARREIETLKADKQFMADLRNPSDLLLREARQETWSKLFAEAYSSTPRQLTAAEAEAKAEAREFLYQMKLKPNSEFVKSYHDRSHVAHEETVARVTEFQRQANLGEPEPARFDSIAFSLNTDGSTTNIS